MQVALMRNRLGTFIAVISLLTTATVGWAQVITGSQTRGQNTDGTLQSTPVTLVRAGFIVNVATDGEGFWIESATGIKMEFPGAKVALTTPVPAGVWKAYPILKAGQNTATVSVTIGPVPPAMTAPVFGPLDRGKMPCFLHELSPQRREAAYILNASTAYTVWAAPKRTGQTYANATWKPFGPWTLAGGRRYIFRVGSGSLVDDPAITTTTPVLSPALASLTWQNDTSDNVWLIVNPLPPPGRCQDTDEGVTLGVGITPQHQTVEAGSSVTLTAKALGGTPPYRYQWFSADKQSDVTTATITYSNLNATGSRTFRIIVTDAAGRRAEAQATAEVVPKASATSPVRTNSPANPTRSGATTASGGTPGGGHWHRGAVDVSWIGSVPTSYEGGQARKLGTTPHSGDRWVGGDQIIRTLELVSSGHEVETTQGVGSSTVNRYEATWTEPPADLFPGQTVQFRVTGGASCYVYRGASTNNTNLAHAEGQTSAPYQIPPPGELSSDTSKAAFGFFCGAHVNNYSYDYHWVEGGSSATSSGPGTAALRASLSPTGLTIASGAKIRLQVNATGGVPPYRYAWYNGDKLDKGTGAALTWDFSRPGPRTIRVEVTDSAGNTVEATSQLNVQ
jgi:SprB repeat